MITDVIEGEIEITKTFHHHLVFGINKEGIVKWDGFVNQKICQYAMAFSITEEREIGDVLTIQTGLEKYHGIVCYSIKDGWEDTPKTIRACLDKIETKDDESIFVATIGSDLFEQMPWHLVRESIKAIHLSKKNCIVYTSQDTKEKILDLINGFGL